MRKLVVVMLMCCLCPLLHADVADQAANGFTVKITTVIHATPEVVYSRLVHNVGDWWNPDHTFSGDPHNLSIDDRPNGCFCEKLPNNGGVRHAEVIMVMPGKRLVMSGGLGPLQGLGAAATMTFILEPMQKDTRVELTYAVGGYMADGLNNFATPVNLVLTDQMTRFKMYVETGTPSADSTKKP